MTHMSPAEYDRLYARPNQEYKDLLLRGKTMTEWLLVRQEKRRLELAKLIDENYERAMRASLGHMVLVRPDVEKLVVERCVWCNSDSPTIDTNIGRFVGFNCHDCGATFLVEA